MSVQRPSTSGPNKRPINAATTTVDSVATARPAPNATKVPRSRLLMNGAACGSELQNQMRAMPEQRPLRGGGERVVQAVVDLADVAPPGAVYDDGEMRVRQ